MEMIFTVNDRQSKIRAIAFDSKQLINHTENKSKEYLLYCSTVRSKCMQSHYYRFSQLKNYIKIKSAYGRILPQSTPQAIAAPQQSFSFRIFVRISQITSAVSSSLEAIVFGLYSIQRLFILQQINRLKPKKTADTGSRWI